ncbi:hypothetical protein Sjap_025621 [Stephania japonica]|uniref:Uncharacterized protein n=1 Tax=Stephania japonica TaxID=461633 RepID=A0AAP0E1Y8_9MAGN
MTFTTINAQPQPSSIIGVTPTVAPLVRDTDGKPVREYVSYHIVPVPGGAGGGGLTLGPNRRDPKACPLSVVQSLREASLGRPIFFGSVPHAPGNRVVRTSTDYHITFNSTNPPIICKSSSFWKLTELNAHARGYFIDSVSILTTELQYLFKIEFAGRIGRESVYKLSYCPTVCKTCPKVHCMDVGAPIDHFADGLRRLKLPAASPLIVRFKKA